MFVVAVAMTVVVVGEDSATEGEQRQQGNNKLGTSGQHRFILHPCRKDSLLWAARRQDPDSRSGCRVQTHSSILCCCNEMEK
jgi:hypothetical protein